MLEARPYRPFKSSEEYLEAMKEDLAEWLSTLYPELCINPDNFMDRLDTGVALCKVSVCGDALPKIPREISASQSDQKGGIALVFMTDSCFLHIKRIKKIKW